MIDWILEKLVFNPGDFLWIPVLIVCLVLLGALKLWEKVEQLVERWRRKK